jgi:hypothetical protein
MHRIASDRRCPSGLMRLFAVLFVAGGLFAVSIGGGGKESSLNTGSLLKIKEREKSWLIFMPRHGGTRVPW